MPKEVEQHLLLKLVRFKTLEDLGKEVVNYMEAKTGNRMVISTNFAKSLQALVLCAHGCGQSHEVGERRSLRAIVTCAASMATGRRTVGPRTSQGARAMLHRDRLARVPRRISSPKRLGKTIFWL